MRLSIDSKASVELGAYSREGKARSFEAKKALDHDMDSKEKLIPLGILETKSGSLDITFGNSAKTSDFVADCIVQWWKIHEKKYPTISTLMFNSDNGQEASGKRSQYLKRMCEFADETGLKLHLVYYPPYHSKYNPIERCWGILEKHWNGTLLETEDLTIGWAKTMTWKGNHPQIHINHKKYQKGITLSKDERKELEKRLYRHPFLPYWDIFIFPTTFLRVV